MKHFLLLCVIGINSYASAQTFSINDLVALNKKEWEFFESTVAANDYYLIDKKADDFDVTETFGYKWNKNGVPASNRVIVKNIKFGKYKSITWLTVFIREIEAFAQNLIPQGFLPKEIDTATGVSRYKKGNITVTITTIKPNGSAYYSVVISEK